MSTWKAGGDGNVLGGAGGAEETLQSKHLAFTEDCRFIVNVDIDKDLGAKHSLAPLWGSPVVFVWQFTCLASLFNNKLLENRSYSPLHPPSLQEGCLTLTRGRRNDQMHECKNEWMDGETSPNTVLSALVT